MPAISTALKIIFSTGLLYLLKNCNLMYSITLLYFNGWYQFLVALPNYH